MFVRVENSLLRLCFGGGARLFAGSLFFCYRLFGKGSNGFLSEFRGRNGYGFLVERRIEGVIFG